MSFEQKLETITCGLLVERVCQLKAEGYRLVQIGGTRLTDGLELTYSFDRDGYLLSLRLHLPPAESPVPSITQVYWCAFLYENELHDLFGLRVNGMAIDFGGNLYRTAVKFPFGTTKAPCATRTPMAPVIEGDGVTRTPSVAGANHN